MNHRSELSAAEYDERATRLAGISKSVFDLITARYFTDTAVPSVSVSYDYNNDGFGASVRAEENRFTLTIRAGTFEFLLKRIREWVYLFDVPALLRADFSTREVDQSEAANKLRDSFSTAFASVAATVLFAHEFTHPLNGHNAIINPRLDGVLTDDELALCQRLRREPLVRHGLEFNADFAAVNWALDLLIERPESIVVGLGASPNVRPNQFIAVIWALAISALAATYSQPYRPDIGMATGTHPAAPVRFESLVRTSRCKLANRPSLLTIFDTISPNVIAAFRDGLMPAAPAFDLSKWRTDIGKDTAQGYLSSIGQTWLTLVSVFDRYKLGSALAFSNEMSAWKETLGWSSTSML